MLAETLLLEEPTLQRRRPEANERRRENRLPIEMDVEVEGAAHRFVATSGDLSTGGMFIVTPMPIPVAAEVMLAFELPNGKRLELLGIVQWRSGPVRGQEVVREGFGVAFFCLAPADKELIERFCRLREPLYFEMGDSDSRASH
jgi:Tfp pilus assembly protein PilZ